MAKYVQSFKDRNGKTVKPGDTVKYPWQDGTFTVKSAYRRGKAGTWVHLDGERASTRADHLELVAKGTQGAKKGERL